MSGGGGGGTRDIIQQVPGGGPPQVLPELQPFVQRVGEISRQALDYPELNLSRFAQDRILQIPGLSGLENQAIGQIGQRSAYGIPTPRSEQAAYGGTANLFGTGMGAAGAGQAGLGGAIGAGAGATAAGGAGLQNFVGSQFGSSPQLQQALAGLESQVLPAVQNQAAKSGLAQSGFLPQEVGRSYARELVPLYMQGMAQQQQAASNLFGGGMQGLLQGGGQMFSGGMQTAGNVIPQLLTMAGREEQRPTEQIKEALSGGELQRSIDLARSQEEMASYQRQRQLAMGLTNPFGSVPSATATPGGITSTSEKSNTSGGFGLGK